ncbi:hypothetical protein WR25_07256 [Diploscapter pachys]|uniref:Uncharacterized protein n=1 Tax=Diploscapter pachys TaxID=2018661 RepID=A0A2A2L8D9_9BILA|nr:hypothetical protein WR25_07256 [Diploscapter pachys]
MMDVKTTVRRKSMADLRLGTSVASLVQIRPQACSGLSNEEYRIGRVDETSDQTERYAQKDELPMSLRIRDYLNEICPSRPSLFKLSLEPGKIVLFLVALAFRRVDSECCGRSHSLLYFRDLGDDLCQTLPSSIDRIGERLSSDECVVGAFPGEQLYVSSLFDHNSFLQNEDSVCILDCRQSVCNHYDSVSSAEVASSSKRILGSLTSALAMEILCFCPPLSCVPLSPTIVSYFCGRVLMNFSAFAIRQAAWICSNVTSKLPYYFDIGSGRVIESNAFKDDVPSNSIAPLAFGTHRVDFWWLKNARANELNCARDMQPKDSPRKNDFRIPFFLAAFTASANLQGLIHQSSILQDDYFLNSISNPFKDTTVLIEEMVSSTILPAFAYFLASC